jgi:formate hydrogenlyase subunit 4
MKFMVVALIGVNVLGTPAGLAANPAPAALAVAVLASSAKLLALGAVLVAFEASFAKLRLLRIPEFLTAAALVALLAGVAATLP